MEDMIVGPEKVVSGNIPDKLKMAIGVSDHATITMVASCD